MRNLSGKEKPPRSENLTKIDLFLGEYVKQQVYKMQRMTLKERMTDIFRNIPIDMLCKLIAPLHVVCSYA